MERTDKEKNDLEARDEEKDGVKTRVVALEVRVDQGFKHVDENFERVDDRFKEVKGDIAKLDAKVDRLDEKFDTKIDALDEKFDTKIDALDEKLDTKIDVLRAETSAGFNDLHKLLLSSSFGIVVSLILLLIGANLTGLLGG